MKKIFTTLLVLIAIQLSSQSYTWTNADNDNDFENPNNWTPTPLFGFPSFGEIAVFDGTSSNGNCIMPADEDFSLLSVLSNYSGVIDATGIDLSLTSISLQGGTLLCPSNTLHVSGNCVKGAGGTFLTSPTSVLEYNLTSSTVRTMNGAFTLANLIIIHTGNGNRTINFSAGTSTCTNLTLLSSPVLSNPSAYRGTINVTSSLTINGTALTSAPNNTGTIAFVGAGNKTIVGSGTSLAHPISNITFNTPGTLAMSNNITLTGTWGVTNLGGLTAGTSLVTMAGGTVTSGNTATSQARFDNLSTKTGSTTIFTNNSVVNFNGNLTNSGAITSNNALYKLNGSGIQTVSGSSLSLNAIEVSSTGAKTISTPINVLDSVKISGAGNLISGGNITLKSTLALKARVAQIAAGGSLSGNITVETIAPGGTTDWAVLGVSGVNGQTLNNWDGQIPMTCNGCISATTDIPGGFASVTSWDETAPAGDPNAYVTLSNTSPLTPGQGFWVYLGTATGTSADITYNVTGVAVTGSTNIPVSNSGVANGDGYNLVSNPYPSPILWSKLHNGNPSVDDAIYIYNADLGLTTSYVSGLSSNVNGANNVIPMGQGFYVRATANTNLSAQESNKVNNNTSANPLLKTSEAQSAGVYFRLNVDGGGFTDATAIRFHPNATTSFNKELDAYKLFSSPGYVGYPGAYNQRTTISTKDNSNVDYSINSLPYATNQNAVIPVMVKVYATDQHTISASDLQNLPPNTCVTLKDKLLNVTHNLVASPYVCNISDTTNSARFELTVCANISVGINNNTIASNSSAILINNDANGVFVNLNYEKSLKTKISITNILGQKIVDDKTVTTEKETVYLNLQQKNQLLFITVDNGIEKVTKKLIY